MSKRKQLIKHNPVQLSNRSDVIAVQTTLPQSVVTVLDQLAARDNRKRADWIRRALIAEVQRRENESAMQLPEKL